MIFQLNTLKPQKKKKNRGYTLPTKAFNFTCYLFEEYTDTNLLSLQPSISGIFHFGLFKNFGPNNSKTSSTDLNLLIYRLKLVL